MSALQEPLNLDMTYWYAIITIFRAVRALNLVVEELFGEIVVMLLATTKSEDGAHADGAVGLRQDTNRRSDWHCEEVGWRFKVLSNC